jgi:hypothetical protein
MKKLRLLGAMCAFIVTVVINSPVSASIFELQFTGKYTLVDSANNVMDHKPISSVFTYNSDLGTGSSAATLEIGQFDTFGNTAYMSNISLQLVSGTNYVIGNMLADWGVNTGVPISMVWDATGLINAIAFGLQADDVISGTSLKRDGSTIFDVSSATPASDGLFNSATGSNLNQGPAPLAMTTLNTTTLCTTGFDCLDNAFSGGEPLTEDFVAGSPMVDGPFTGLNVNFDIGSGNSLTVLSVSNVPIPGAIWLFGSGLLGLVGIARRKKSA